MLIKVWQSRLYKNAHLIFFISLVLAVFWPEAASLALPAEGVKEQRMVAGLRANWNKIYKYGNGLKVWLSLMYDQTVLSHLNPHKYAGYIFTNCLAFSSVFLPLASFFFPYLSVSVSLSVSLPFQMLPVHGGKLPKQGALQMMYIYHLTQHLASQ